MRGSRMILLAALTLAVSLLSGEMVAGGISFRRGDANGDARLNITDGVFTLRFLFQGGRAPGCADSADANYDGWIDLTDPVYVLNFLCRGGPAAPPPGADCGPDPTPDPLGCAEYPGCGPQGDVRPEIFAFSISPNGGLAFLIYDGPLGFRRGASVLRLHGRHFGSVEEAVFSDRFGNRRRVGAAELVRDSLPGGLETLSLELHDERTDVRLAFRGKRDNMGVQLRGPGGLSNRIEVPVASRGDIDPLGGVISGTKVPTRPTTGPVRVRYTLYDIVVSSPWALQVDYSLDDGVTWFVARPLESDPEHDGTSGLLPGSFEHASGHDLLPGRGAMRTFTWDGRLPEEELARVRNEGGKAAVRFRLRLVPESVGAAFAIEHVAETPPVDYRVLPAELRDAVLVETFDDDLREDRGATSALWGPPENPGRLLGRTDGPSPFGSGRAVVRLANLSRDLLKPGESVVDEFIELNTDRMEIVHHVVVDNGTPADPGDDVSRAFLEPLVDGNGDPAENPGEPLNEFHLAVLTVAPGLRVHGVGSHPLVLRLSGAADNPGGIAFHLGGEATLDLGGSSGGDSASLGSCPAPPNCGSVVARGGRGGAGGGRGGDRARVPVVPGGAVVRELSEAGPGGQDGGGGGATPAAVDFELLRALSIFHGAPGGGGGHRTAGEAGDYGRSSIAQYRIPRPGEGGASRGDVLFARLGGSGGGGGGGSLSRADGCNGPYFTTAGAGGGGGGGAIRVVARGRIVVDGLISADGGNGGSGDIPHYHPPPPCDYPHRQNQIATGGAGGGGSGGSILLQATGDIELGECSRLEVRGGAGGESARGGNQRGGAGAPGTIRLESAGGALPACGEDVSTGPFLTEAVESAGVSRPLHLGLGADVDVSSLAITPGVPELVLDGPLPPGTRVFLLWDGGRESLDALGEVEVFPRLVADPALLEHREFVRFHVLFRANGSTRQSPAIRELRLPYRLRAKP
ncbi:MAG: hypothetical protein O7J95_06425 [Planctomycetota bacterium]|nr:hypothetical protein [Planctomycetota bacterium]